MRGMVQAITSRVGMGEKKQFDKADRERKGLAYLAINNTLFSGQNPAMSQQLVNSLIGGIGQAPSPEALEEALKDPAERSAGYLKDINSFILKNEAKFQDTMVRIGGKMVGSLARLEGSVLDLVHKFVGDDTPSTKREAAKQLETHRKGMGGYGPMDAFMDFFGAGPLAHEKELAKESESVSKALKTGEDITAADVRRAKSEQGSGLGFSAKQYLKAGQIPEFGIHGQTSRMTAIDQLQSEKQEARKNLENINKTHELHQKSGSERDLTAEQAYKKDKIDWIEKLSTVLDGKVDKNAMDQQAGSKGITHEE